jgi:hypothetical protein
LHGKVFTGNGEFENCGERGDLLQLRGDSDSLKSNAEQFSAVVTSISQCPYANSLRKSFQPPPTSSNGFDAFHLQSQRRLLSYAPEQAAICPSGLSVVDSSLATAAMVSAAEAVQMMR